MQDIQNILIKKRKDLGLSLRNAAKLIGISHSYLSTLEKGKDPRNNAPISPTPETLQLISKAYNISYSELMKIAGYLPSHQDDESMTSVTQIETETLAEEFLDMLIRHKK
ncbi:hypothetical protein C3495_05680 [Clostridiaceae bacterium 14S0207]|nr:hypothetical protein C3495_05680 [Clostridiaceae bacterium 14S0207]